MAQQTTLRALDRALRDAFSANQRRRFPQFRRADDRTDRATVPRVALRTLRTPEGEITHIGFPNLPLLRVRGIRLRPGSRITYGTIRMRGDICEVSLSLIAPSPTYAEPTREGCGIDMGCGSRLATIAAVSDEQIQIIENPRFKDRHLKRLRRAGRRLSRRTKGSVGRKRAAQTLARLHRRIMCLRDNHAHQATKRLIDQNAQICIETLNVAGMARTTLSRTISDAAISIFIAQIRYKASWARRTLSEHDRWARSTGCCPDCEWVGPKLPLGKREWICAQCARKHDRDVAAAKWLHKVGRRTPEPETSSPKRGFAGREGRGMRRGSSTRSPSNPGVHLTERMV